LKHRTGGSGKRPGVADCRTTNSNSSLPRLARQERDGDLDFRGRDRLQQRGETPDLHQPAAGFRNRCTRRDELMKKHP
jgi:hypothetical protein